MFSGCVCSNASTDQGVQLVSQQKALSQEELQCRLETEVGLPPDRAVVVEIKPFRPEKDLEVVKDGEHTEIEKEILQRFLNEEAAKGCMGRFHVAAFHFGDHFLKAHPPASLHSHALPGKTTHSFTHTHTP
jgi:hypothetical protein